MVAEREDRMANLLEVPIGDPQESYTCSQCEDGDGEWYADNNGSEELLWYCGTCDDRRAEKYGCARIIKEGCGCSPGPEECACGCVGTGRL